MITAHSRKRKLVFTCCAALCYKKKTGKEMKNVCIQRCKSSCSGEAICSTATVWADSNLASKTPGSRSAKAIFPYECSSSQSDSQPHSSWLCGPVLPAAHTPCTPSASHAGLPAWPDWGPPRLAHVLQHLLCLAVPLLLQSQFRSQYLLPVPVHLCQSTGLLGCPLFICCPFFKNAVMTERLEGHSRVNPCS